MKRGPGPSSLAPLRRRIPGATTDYNSYAACCGFVYTVSPVKSISIWNANRPMKSEAKMAFMEGNFVRQFQSPTRSCTSVLVSHAAFYIF